MRENKNSKSVLIGTIITFVASLIVAGLIFGIGVLVRLGEGNTWDYDMLINFVDAFSLSGLLGILVYLMSWSSAKGAFDIFGYSIKLLWYNTFHKNIRETALPKSYAEYKELKRGEETASTLFILYGSIPVILVGIVLFIIYKVTFK